MRTMLRQSARDLAFAAVAAGIQYSMKWSLVPGVTSRCFQLHLPIRLQTLMGGRVPFYGRNRARKCTHFIPWGPRAPKPSGHI